MSDAEFLYKSAITWCALNDEPGASFSMNADDIKGLMCTALVADVFDVLELKVAQDIVELRGKIREGKRKLDNKGGR